MYCKIIIPLCGPVKFSEKIDIGPHCGMIRKKQSAMFEWKKGISRSE
jgi:hypothetical protein